jgi:hypothetical protein
MEELGSHQRREGVEQNEGIEAFHSEITTITQMKNEEEDAMESAGGKKR